ncbi:MAG: hypothetical protein E7265_06415 [Lachnospiraceae bacterium]|nr:hypothetical protein [Lachnospiraceae bacterium]
MGYCSLCGKQIKYNSGLCEECKDKSSMKEDYMDALLRSMDTGSDDKVMDTMEKSAETADIYDVADVMDGSSEDVDIDELDLNSTLSATDDVEPPSLEEMMSAGGTDELDALLAADEIAETELISDGLESVPEELISDDLATEELISDELVPEGLISDALAPDELISDEITPEALISDDLAPDELIPDELAPEGLISDALASEEFISDELAPEGLISDDLASDELISDEITQEALISDDLASDELISDEMAPEALISDDLAPEELISDEMAPEGLISDELVSDELISDEMAPEALISDDLASDELISDEIAPEALISDEFASDELISDEMAPEALISDDLASEELISDELVPEGVSETMVSGEEGTEILATEGVPSEKSGSADGEEEFNIDTFNLDELDLMSLLTGDDTDFETIWEDSPVESESGTEDAVGQNVAVEGDNNDLSGGEQHHESDFGDLGYGLDGRENVSLETSQTDEVDALLGDLSADLQMEEGSAESYGDGHSMSDVFQDALSALSSEQDEEESGDDVNALLDNVRSNSKKKERKSIKSVFGRLFGNIVDDKEIEKAKAIREQAAEDEKNKTELEAKKKEEAEEKKKAKEEEKEKKAKLKEEKKRQKEEKKEAKKEAKELRELEEEAEIEGRINKVGAAIVFVVLGLMGASIFFGTRMFSYNSGIKNAQEYFDRGQYEESYKELLGVDLKEKDQELYQKIVTVMRVYKELEAYDVYYKESRYPEALDSLFKGIRQYEKYFPDAVELDVTSDLDYVKSQIVTELEAEFGITEEMAKEINKITDNAEYSRRVYDLAQYVVSHEKYGY